MCYVEVAILELAGPGAYIGVARSWLDPNRKFAYGGEDFWGIGMAGRLWHAYDATKTSVSMAGMQSFTQNDTIGLLIDCYKEVLTIYKNGAKLGTAVANGLRLARALLCCLGTPVTVFAHNRNQLHRIHCLSRITAEPSDNTTEQIFRRSIWSTGIH